MSEEQKVKPGDVISEDDLIRAALIQNSIIKAIKTSDGSRIVVSVTPETKKNSR